MMPNKMLHTKTELGVLFELEGREGLCWFFFFNIFIGVQLLYNDVLVSAL